MDASSVRVIRIERITHAGVTAGTTVDRISGYSRPQRCVRDETGFPACDDGPLSRDMPAPARANRGRQTGLKRLRQGYGESR